jgi:polysaccharide deacetylase 2 family uncharacterized protein YibQ
MTADDLSTPLGQHQKKRRSTIPISVSQALGGALALFFAVFVLWAVISDNPFGGEPMVVVPISQKVATAAKPAEGPKPPDVVYGNPGRYDGPAATQPQSPPQPQPVKSAQAPAAGPAAGNTKTITIIDGTTGQRQEVVIPAPANDAAAAAPEAGPADMKFAEMTPQGPVPKIAADRVRPADAFAQPVKGIPGKPDAPRIAIVVAGLGVSTSATSDAIAKLPGAVTFGFMPYASDVAALAARARDRGHEVLLQLPMEPFDYPDNDPGPQALLTSLAPQQNLERLYWLMSRFQGYVGMASAMGARFTASEPSFAPVLREAAKRGLIFVDDGSNPRSLAGRIAGANSLPFAKADVVIDSVPTPVEIDRALGRLEMAARERGVAVGIASPLPGSIDHIAKWAKTLESRGLLLVPITAVAIKAKQT